MQAVGTSRRLLAEFFTLGAFIREPEERGKGREGGNGDKSDGAALTNLFFRNTSLCVDVHLGRRTLKTGKHEGNGPIDLRRQGL